MACDSEIVATGGKMSRRWRMCIGTRTLGAAREAEARDEMPPTGAVDAVYASLGFIPEVAAGRELPAR